MFRTEGRLRPHQTSPTEIDDLLRVAARGVADAHVSGVSSDRRSLIAYDAALTLATIPSTVTAWSRTGRATIG